MHLLFCINRNFCWMLVQCLRSIVRYPCTTGYTAHILHSDLTAEDLAQMQQAVPEAEILEAKVDESFFRDFPETSRYPKQIYYRIFAAQFLPDDLERILYLDTDTIVIRSLEELYRKPFEGASYIACTHVRALFNKMNCLRLGITEDVPYLNTGVMLLNLPKLRQQQTTEDVLAFVSDKKNRLLLPDQDIISALYGQSIIPLDPIQYNMTEKLFTFHRFNGDGMTLDDVRQRSAVIHYCGRNKPWKPGYAGELDVFYNETVSQMEKDLS